jgi:hypothetical protein
VPDLTIPLAENRLKRLEIAFADVCGGATSKPLHIDPHDFSRALMVIDQLVGTHNDAVLAGIVNMHFDHLHWANPYDLR